MIRPYGADTAFWNMLDSIDPDSDTARSDLTRLCQAFFIPSTLNSDTGDHFTETTMIGLRGFMAQVKTAYPEEQQHLGTVFDLIKCGEPDGSAVDADKILQVIEDMGRNDACDGAPMEAASLINAMSPNERGGMFSTIARAIDWINDTPVRWVISGRSSFDFADIKRKNETVILSIPERYIAQSVRFLRAFYTAALDVLDNHATQQPEDSERRTLVVFDELNSLQNFKPAETVANYGRSSHLKGIFLVQNLGILYDWYKNPDNFLANSDLIIFGLHRADVKGRDLVEKSLGTYTEEWEEGRAVREAERKLLPGSEVNEFLRAKNPRVLLIPADGFPLRLERVPYYKLFPKSAYGQQSAQETREEPVVKEESQDTTDAPQEDVQEPEQLEPEEFDLFAYDPAVNWELRLEILQSTGSLSDPDRVKLLANIARQKQRGVLENV